MDFLNSDFVQLVLAIVIAMAVFAVLWKVFKFAIRTAVVVALLILGFYLAFGVIGIQLPEVMNWLESFVDQF